MFKTKVFYPLLFSIYPILALISHNIDQLQFWEVQRSLLIIPTTAMVMLVLLRLLIKDWERAGLLCSLIIILFFSYGHVLRLVIGYSVSNILIGRADYLLALWAFLFINVAWFILRKLKNPIKFINFLNIVAIIVIILASYNIILFNYSKRGNKEFRSTDQLNIVSLMASSTNKNPPDIYFIIVDGYGRSDVLKDIYSYDNSEFIKYLEEKGFFVAKNSHSNYAQTALSLSSTLNYEYINYLTDYMGEDSLDRSPLVDLIKNSRVRSFLDNLEYKFVAFGSGYTVTEITNADIYISMSEILNPFETMLMNSSVGIIWMDKKIPFYRYRIINTLDMLSSMPDIESPKFVFAHILSPHPPFIFGPNGEVLPPKGFREGNYYNGTTEEYIEGYRGQIIYLNKLLIRAIDGLLENSETEPIIILQGDHGPGSQLNWDTFAQTCFKERFSILNAYYLPSNGNKDLYDTISPVNTFRYVLDNYFYTELDLIDDNNYFSLENKPYDFIKVNDWVDDCQVGNQNR